MLNLLVVDDEPYILNGLQQIIHGLETPFTDISGAIDAFRALDMIEGHKPDLIISDIQMPGMSGLEFIREAKSRGCRRFIILTGHEEFHYAREALRYGVIDYLLKPLNEDNLHKLLVGIAQQIFEEKMETGELDYLLEGQSPNGNIRLFQKYLLSHYTKGISLHDAAAHIHLHPNYLSRLLQDHTGKSFLQHVHFLRLEMAKRMLGNSTYTVDQVSKQVGFENTQYFHKIFKREMKVTPGEYRRMVLERSASEYDKHDI